MDERVVIFQYLLDHLPKDAHRVSLNIMDHEVFFARGDVLVNKTLGSEHFNVADPECAEKVFAYLSEPEGQIVKLNMDDWFRVISEDELIKILLDPEIENWIDRYKAIDKASKASHSHNSFDGHDWYVTNGCERDFREFALEFLQCDGPLDADDILPW